MICGYDRGHATYCEWRYIDNNEIVCDARPCKRCGRPPTKDGHDACLGHLDGVASACCGHGGRAPFVIYTHCYFVRVVLRVLRLCFRYV